jgi:two-component system sensor histidine kinase YesM
MAGRNSGFGLRNVHARIAMIFGDPYGLEIKSKIHEGTEVIIKIPMLTGEEAANISGGVESA